MDREDTFGGFGFFGGLTFGLFVNKIFDLVDMPWIVVIIPFIITIILIIIFFANRT